MRFKYPSSCTGYQTVRYMPNNDIELAYKDVESLFDKTWLNDGLIGFVLECLNFYNYHTDGTSTAPNILFGTPLDYVNIMCNKDHLPKIYDHLNHGKNSSIPFELSEVHCSRMLKYWYCKETKHCTSKILDFFTDKKNQIIKKYLNVIQINLSHWICVEAQLSDSTSNFIPKIYTIDPYGSDNSTEVTVRRWYAKFFGLYYKEFKHGPLKDHDFNGRDLYYDKNYNNPTMGMDQKEFPSYLVHASKDPTLLQMDNFNCGIHCIIECIAQLCGGHKYYQPSSKQQHKQLNHFRLCILTMIKKIYLELNEEYIYPIERHIHMKFGNVYKNTDVEKFLTIHKLFNFGHFTLDMNKEDTQNGNANDVARFVEKKHIDKAWKILKIDLGIQSQRLSNPNVATETSNKKISSKTATKLTIKLSTKKSQTVRGKQLRIDEDNDDEGDGDYNINLEKKKSKNKQRGERKAKASDFVVNDSDLSLERMWLNQLDQRSRHQTVYDVSDTILFLEEKKESNPIEVYPKEIVDRILNLYCKCYRPQELERTKKTVIRAYFEKHMRKYPSYFVMDYVMDTARNIKVYEVIATILFEASVFLNEIDHSIFHMVAIEPGFEETQHIDLLLQYMCRTTRISTKDCFMLTKFGKFPYKSQGITGQILYNLRSPEKYFKQIGFQSSHIPKNLKLAINKLLEPQSTYILGSGEKINNKTRKAIGFNKDVKILMTHDYIKTMGLYNKTHTRFEVYSHPFGWRPVPLNEDGYLASADKKIMITNPRKKLKLKGGGSRSESLNSVLDESDKKFELNPEIIKYQKKI